MSGEMLILFKLLLVTVIGLLLYGIARHGIRSMGRRGLLSEQSVTIVSGIIKWVLLIAVILIGLNLIGISVTTIWASISAILMLVAIGFVAVWSILSNASCALFLVVFAPFRIGDEIEVLEPSALDPAKPGIRGRVRDISFLYTTVEQTGDEEETFIVRIPNNQFFQKAIRCRAGTNTKSLKHALFETPVRDGSGEEGP